VRPPIVIGPADLTTVTLFRSIRRIRSFLVLGRRQRYSMIHAADLAVALISAAKHGKRVPAPGKDGQNGSNDGQVYYFVAADEHPTFGQFGRMIGRSINRPYALAVPFPRHSMWLFGAFGEAIGRLVGKPQYLSFERAREVTAGHWICSPEKAARE